MGEYTEAFAQFILQARDAYRDLCEQVDRGLVPAGRSATVRITLTPAMVDEVRQDRLAAASNGADRG